MGVDCFEKLIAWQKARELSRAVYAFTRKEAASRDFALCNQIRRAAISVMSNITEGFERARPREFHQFLSIAKGSSAEVRSLIYAAQDVGYIKGEEFELLMTMVKDVGRLVGALRASVERRLMVNNKRTKSQAPTTQTNTAPEYSAHSTQHSSPEGDFE